MACLLHKRLNNSLELDFWLNSLNLTMSSFSFYNMHVQRIYIKTLTTVQEKTFQMLYKYNYN